MTLGSRRRRRICVLLCAVVVAPISLMVVAGAARASELSDLAFDIVKGIVHEDRIVPVELPRLSEVAWTSALHPDYVDAPVGSTLRSEEDAAAKTAASDVGASSLGIAEVTTADPSIREQITEGLRDCTKEGVEKTAWNLWWSQTMNESFVVNDELQGVISGCLQQFGAPEDAAHAIAGEMVANLDQGLSALPAAVSQDFAALSNWLRVANLYYIK
jgi:hypothetical protein